MNTIMPAMHKARASHSCALAADPGFQAELGYLWRSLVCVWHGLYAPFLFEGCHLHLFLMMISNLLEVYFS